MCSAVQPAKNNNMITRLSVSLVLVLFVLLLINKVHFKRAEMIVISFIYGNPSLLLFAWKFQMELDKLFSRILHDHNRVIGAAPLFRPEAFHGGAAFFQQLRRHF